MIPGRSLFIRIVDPQQHTNGVLEFCEGSVGLNQFSFFFGFCYKVVKIDFLDFLSESVN